MTNIEQVEFDHMPREVAIELLCKQTRISNRQRKECMRALETRYRSTLTPKTDKADLVLRRRLTLRPMSFLLKVKKRCETRRSLCMAQRDFSSRRSANLGEKTGKPNPAEMNELLVHQRAIVLLNERISLLNRVFNAVSDEMARRQNTFVTR